MRLSCSHMPAGVLPAVVVSLSALAGCRTEGAPARLADARDGVNRPYGLALDDSRVYWTERGAGGAIRSVARAGGPVTTLVHGASPYAWFCATDGHHVYWTEFDAGTLRRVPVAGGEAETLERGRQAPGQLCVRDGWVTWVEYAGNAILRRRTAGGRAEVFVGGLAGPQALAVDTEAVYWTEFSDPPVLRRRSLRGGPVVTLAEVRPECWLVRAGAWLWWTETRGSLRRIPSRGGPSETLAAIPPSGAFAAASDLWLYWAEEHGHVMHRVSLEGGPPEVLLTGLRHPAVMAADARGVCWTDPEEQAVYAWTPKDHAARRPQTVSRSPTAATAAAEP